MSLRLRTTAVSEVDATRRGDLTFVFDAEDDFVVRSILGRDDLGNRKSRTRFDYDHPDGRPVLRSEVTQDFNGTWTNRLDVEECRFGPIPETEFTPEVFLVSLGPGRIARPLDAHRALATLNAWWAGAFALGGLSLAGGLVPGRRDRPSSQGAESSGPVSG